MQIDLSALLRGEIHQIPVDLMIEEGCASAPDGIVLLPGAHIKGTVTDSGGYIRLESVASIPYRGECARCLDPVEDTLEFDFDRTLVTEGTVSDEELEEQADEYLVISHGVLGLDEALSESVFLEFPMVLLCSPDCRGLCPHCGRKLTGSEICGCTPREIDPRWSKLREIQWDENGGIKKS